MKACVDEAMRLAPPVPGLLPREVIAKEGATIDGIHIPVGTVVGTPCYALHHYEKYYPQAWKYLPERWLDAPEEQIEEARSAFAPFSIGARGCIGKGVAYMELRLAVARLVWTYEMRKRKVEGKGEVWREGFKVKDGEFPLQDHFTSVKEGPVVEFEKRQI